MSEEELYKFCMDYIKEEDGVLSWKDKPYHNVKLGKTLNRKRKDGYEDVKIKGTRYLVHRIVWLIHNQGLPRFTIDHIDGRRDNNKITNLQDVTQSENNTNTGKGYYWCKREEKFLVYQTVSKGMRKYIGRYTTEAQAKAKVAEVRGTINVACEG